MSTQGQHIKPRRTASKQTNNKPKRNKGLRTNAKTTTCQQPLITQFINITQRTSDFTQSNTRDNNTNKNSPSIKTSNASTESRQRQRFIQIEIPKYNIGNDTFGDDIQPDDQNEIFYFHNINGIKSDENWAQILQTLHEQT
jgi:hypothetical protein